MLKSMTYSEHFFFNNKKSLKIPKGGNQNLYIEEQTTQWPKEKVQKDKERSSNTNPTKNRGWTQVLDGSRSIQVLYYLCISALSIEHQ
jgi:hypothetical protein